MSDIQLIRKILNIGIYTENIKNIIENIAEKNDDPKIFEEYVFIKYCEDFMKMRCFKIDRVSKFEKNLDDEAINNIIVYNGISNKKSIIHENNLYIFGKPVITKRVTELNLDIFFINIDPNNIFEDLKKVEDNNYNDYDDYIIYDENDLFCLSSKYDLIDNKRIIPGNLANIYCNNLPKESLTKIDENVIKDFAKINGILKSPFNQNNFELGLEKIFYENNKDIFIKYLEKYGIKSHKKEYLPIDNLENFSYYDGNIKEVKYIYYISGWEKSILDNESYDILKYYFETLKNSEVLKNDQIFSVSYNFNNPNDILFLSKYSSSFYDRLIKIPSGTKLVKISGGFFSTFVPNISKKINYETLLENIYKYEPITLTPSENEEIIFKHNSLKDGKYFEILRKNKPFFTFSTGRKGIYLYFNHCSKHKNIFKMMQNVDNVLLCRASDQKTNKIYKYILEILQGNESVYPINHNFILEYFSKYPNNKDLKNFLDYYENKFKF